MTVLLAAVTVGSLAAQPAGATTAVRGQAQHVTAAAGAAAPLPAGEKRACSVPTQPGEMMCQAVYVIGRTARSSLKAKAGILASITGYRPHDLQSAYGLIKASGRRGKGETIAIVDAFRDPNAAQDLFQYRKQFHLRPCTKKTRCLRIVNEHGRASHLPRADAGWAEEESLDLDMVSAICPRCRILLVEAPDFIGESHFNGDFNHRGVVMDFAAGDYGYGSTNHHFPWGVAYPTDLPFVTAVGGTSLTFAPSTKRHWTESVWGSAASPNGANSGCTNKSRPKWQRGVLSKRHGCRFRVENDVSAAADPMNGVAIYDTFRPPAPQQPGWLEVGGTSAATPIITAIYALAGRPGRHDYPVQYAYRNRGDYNDVLAGQNGMCPRVPWLCHAVKGFDGPTGLGTPNGWKALSRT
jgi:subtilase family serine protease